MKLRFHDNSCLKHDGRIEDAIAFAPVTQAGASFEEGRARVVAPRAHKS